MATEDVRSTTSLTTRSPQISGHEIASTLVPPRQFEGATFESYRPDPAYPSQADAVEALREFAAGGASRGGGGFFGFGRKKAPEAKPGVYLDGGFGVGKTHLLAAIWHAVPGRTYFGTFIEYTALVGALGYAATVSLLKGSALLCIDEFELDDPGDTMLMTRLLGELVASGTRIAATSNTPPNALGEGRFAAADFLREIQSMSEHFRTMRIDGTDYRRRDIEGHAVVRTDGVIDETLQHAPAGATVTDDTFLDAVHHLGTVHPSRYIKVIDGLDAIVLRDVSALTDQTDALRLVAFIDRVYDAQIPVLSSGTPLDEVFGGGMLDGGYRKKYLRSMSRLIALTSMTPFA
ncbi:MULTISPECIES: cell division protein ZapE [unclassified Rathayibacter]|uniref:cell division protein ZapE n=1 Tax=unclassified Rathayibacter TaxID=2609250 RepID=UPI00188AB89A|nr:MULTISPECIES: cell division protein ZapE [unclassified Rathayibacter]MBF4462318.1 cell division protein ZapE [Rathayibacter sp. VKM Ac-2879]MBF4503639.1 cell division protein ZapE [Rathayibacter sp. VKM Ac-2878]